MEICAKEIRVQGNLIRTARLAAEKYDFLGDPAPAVEALRRLKERVDIFTFLQKLPDTTPKYTYAMEWDNFAALPITTYEHWWTKQVDNKTRNMVRRAEKKGLTVREVPLDQALVEGIWRIYNESPIRQGKPFPHYGKDIDRVERESATYLDRSVFIGAYLGTELAGFVKLTWEETQSQAGIMNFVAMIKHRDYAPTNALVAQAVRSCATLQIPYLTYANFAYGNKQRDSLANFKQNNGFRKIDVPRYYVPLTLVGSVALRLGLHKRLADFVPEPVITKYLEYRKAWYDRKIQSAPQAS